MRLSPNEPAIMSLKKTDLARLLELKLEGQRKGAAIPGRFGQSAAALPDRRAQRKLDSAAGLVPFACKLPAELVQRLRERATTHDGGINALVAQWLGQALDAG